MLATPLCPPRIIDRALSHATVLALLTVVILPAEAVNTARGQGVNSTEPRTEAAVVAADNAWEHAEESGDVAYIDALLLPEYLSVNVDGSFNDKEAIFGFTKKNLGSTRRAAADEAWHATHPYLVSVEITGDIAVLTFTLNKPDTPKRVMSCDVFVYREGHWHALYSLHTAASA
jgi:hypothetical protein